VSAPKPISPSSAEAFLQCKRRYALDFFNASKGFSEALHFGKAMHRTFQHLAEAHQNTGNWLELEEAGSVLSGYLNDFESNKPIPPRDQLERLHTGWLEDGMPKLQAFLHQIAPLIERARVVNTERWVKLDLLDPTGTVRATGRVDLILEMPDQEIWVIDFKTGRVRDALEHSYPLALYVQSAQLEHPDALVRAFEVYLEPYQMLEYNTDYVIEDLEHLAQIGRDAFSESVFPKCKSALCAWCDYVQICYPNDNALLKQAA
jgi:CRISPR/Cas system-associated exonuclease Cas4 (RecB family)